jgi:putative phosphoribosyl transferase
MFADREDAGRQLAELLSGYANDRPVIVALPRGGVAVAAQVAERLGAPLDVMVVRKLGCPWQPELGMGAIAEGGVRVVNDDLVRELNLTHEQLAAVTEREERELAGRVVRYRAGRAPVSVEGRSVILVDDGVATGYTVRAAIDALRRRGAGHVILAVPVASDDAVTALRAIADDVIAIVTSSWFFAIGDFYDDFGQVSDEEVETLLERAAATRA